MMGRAYANIDTDDRVSISNTNGNRQRFGRIHSKEYEFIGTVNPGGEDFVQALKLMKYGMLKLDGLIDSVFDFDLTKLSIHTLDIGLAGIVYSIMAIYFCISLGSLFSSHKILAAVLIYFGLNMVLQVITSGTTFITGIISNDLAGSFPLILLLNAFMELALAVVFYFINRYIMDKKLNLQ